MVITWLIYVAGALLHVLKRGSDSVRITKKYPTMVGYFEAEWVSAAIRTFISTMGFLVWIEQPEFFNKLLADIGIVLPLTHATAGIYGYFSDSLTNFVFQRFGPLKAELPSD